MIKAAEKRIVEALSRSGHFYASPILPEVGYSTLLNPQDGRGSLDVLDKNKHKDSVLIAILQPTKQLGELLLEDYDN